jgi:putative DNA primase/helicase
MNTTNLAPPCPFVAPADQLARAKDVAGAVRFSELAPQKVRWLWPDRIPLGRITLLVSDPGLGKSLLTLDIAARVSRGAPWPDEASVECGIGSGESKAGVECGTGNGESNSALPIPNSPLRLPASVLLLTAEDDFADTVRPRLEALGADLDRILGIAAVPGDKLQDVPRGFALNRDLTRLRNLLEAMPDCRLVVIDPINAYLGSSNADVQALLYTLTTIARERDVAVLIVSQLRKKDGAAVYRAMGSVAFVAAARASWAICKDPENDRKRLLLPLKNNLAVNACGLAFTIESRDAIPHLQWSPEPVTQSLELAIAATRANGRPDQERQHAVAWLRDRLSQGPRVTKDLKEEADANGISFWTLRRAFRDLDGEAVRHGPFPFGQWKWKLPGVEGQNPGGDFWPSTDFFDQFADLFKPWTPPPTPNS